MFRFSTVMCLSLAATSAAGDFSLEFPVDCELGNTCHIQYLVDVDPSANVADFQCGRLTYDGHKGTDFALPSLAAQAEGVTVFAAAAGTIVGVRNDMEDILQFGPDAPDVSDRECGNGVVITHDDGYETQYCHLAKGSVTVSTGQMVDAGTPIGKIGLSGKTQFPHLHLSVRHNGAVVDPFDTIEAQRCDDDDDPIWAEVPTTPAGGLITIGLHDGIPDYQEVKAGTAETPITRTSPALVGWSFAYMAQAGDQLVSRITGPHGEVISHTETLQKDQAQLFRAAGKRRPMGGWPAGDYVLDVTFVRADTVIDTASHSFSID